MSDIFLLNTYLESEKKNMNNEFRYIYLVSMLETDTNIDIRIISLADMNVG
jgi:hypothetical protein